MYLIKSKDSVNLECHILYVTASNFLCLIQIYGPDYWPKKIIRTLLTPWAGRLIFFNSPVVLELKSLKQSGSLTFLMILNFHQKNWSITPHIHVKKIIYKIIYTFSNFEKPKQHLIKATVIAEVEMYNLYDYFYYKGFLLIVCLTIVTLILIVMFWSGTAGFHQTVVLIYWVGLSFCSAGLLVIGVSWTLIMVGGSINVLLNLWLIYPPIK